MSNDSDRRERERAEQAQAQDQDQEQALDPDEAATDYASREDFAVDRAETGELLPQDQYTEIGLVAAKPMPYGEIQRRFGSMNEMADLGDGEVADLISKKITNPDMSGLTADELADYKPLAPRELLFAIMAASGIDVGGIDVASDGSAEIDFDEQGN